ncbi:TIGR02391 family protein [Candidatus Poribacteria bacterium]|nr:MAG: TIGR02391 family protein [Candidatus Poribacteria bacterium]
MSSIYELIPDHELLISLEPEELAGVVLEYLHSLPKSDSQFSFHNFSLPHTVAEYPGEYQQNITRALREAWMWLQNEGFIIPTPGFHPDMVSITRKGERIKNAETLEAYRQADLLPRQLLHPTIAEDIWLLFSRGRYDAAVLQAFKAVEVAVRSASGYTEYYGTDLMRKAFHHERGPLTDTSQPEAEKQATSHLFAAAIGLYKNPYSHQNVPVTAEEAAELIIFASHLLRIIDSRAPTLIDL